MDRTKRYIKDLTSSTALMRKFAARYLRDCGDERAYKPLIAALADAENDVRLEAVKTLGTIGDESVLPALLRASSDPDASVASAAKEAADAVQARRPKPAPAATPAPAGPPAEGASPSARRSFVEEAVGDAAAEIRERGYGVRVELDLPKGRRQVVRVVYGRSDPDGDPLITVYTVCGKADPNRYHWALRANTGLPFGALAVREVDGVEHLVLLENLLEADTTVRELRKAVFTLAEKGDLIESHLSRTDAF